MATHPAHGGDNGEAGGHVEAQTRHLAQVGALATQDLQRERRQRVCNRCVDQGPGRVAGAEVGPAPRPLFGEARRGTGLTCFMLLLPWLWPFLNTNTLRPCGAVGDRLNAGHLGGRTRRAVGGGEGALLGWGGSAVLLGGRRW